MSRNPPHVPGRLWAPESYKKASAYERNLVVNGCGSAGAKIKFVPNTVYLLSIIHACYIHDWMYHVGKTEEDKREADRVFLNNMNRIVEDANSHRYLEWLRKRRVKKYYFAVKYAGGPAYWDPKNLIEAQKDDS